MYALQGGTARNDRLGVPVDYPADGLLKTSSCYDDIVARETQKLVKKIAVQMKDHTFPGTALISVKSFLQEFK